METAAPKQEGLGFDSHKAVQEAPDSLCLDGTANTEMRAKFEKMCRDAQNMICKAVEEEDGEGKFHEDCWTRENGGGGISRVLTGGKVWEKAGCNLSVVYGSMPQEALAAANDRLKFGATDRGKGYKPGERVPFFACGLSSVMHPRNPHCPTMHFNYRYFETEGGVWWFGGGTDITPAYLDTDDMKHFHGTYKEIADKHDPEFYPKFKAWADEYFFIKHRGETRGLGGIFFDDLNDRDPDTIFAFSKECCNAVPDAYLPIIKVLLCIHCVLHVEYIALACAAFECVGVAAYAWRVHVHVCTCIRTAGIYVLKLRLEGQVCGLSVKRAHPCRHIMIGARLRVCARACACASHVDVCCVPFVC